MTLPQLTAEIYEDLSSFSKEINRSSIKTNVINQLRKFGTNVTQLKEKVLIIKNSRVELPDDFLSLRLALRLHGEGYCINGDREPAMQVIRQRIENGAFFDEVSQEYITTCNPKIITEKIAVSNSHVDFYYSPRWLSLVKGIKRDGLDSKCLNIHPSIRNSYPDEINITEGVLNTNFSTGQVYIQYNALQTDEEGQVIIPEYTTRDIVDYITVFCKAKIAEKIIGNNQNPQGLNLLFPGWVQSLPLLKSAALKEARFAGLPKNWSKKFKQKQKEDISFYNLPGLPHV